MSFLKKLFKRTVEITTVKTIRLDVYSSPDDVDPSVVSGAMIDTVVNAPMLDGFQIVRSDVNDCDRISINPVTRVKIRKNGRYAKIPVVVHTLIITRSITSEVSKRVYKTCDIGEMQETKRTELRKIMNDLIEKMSDKIESGKMTEPWYQFDDPVVTVAMHVEE